MTNRSLASSYLLKARTRLLVLHLLQKEEAYSDVVREAQELVELAVRDHHPRFPGLTAAELERLAAASSWLRREREASLSGDIDFIPTEQYGPDAGPRAIDDASFVLDVVTRVVQLPEAP